MTQNSKWYGKWLDVQADRDRLAAENAELRAGQQTAYENLVKVAKRAKASAARVRELEAALASIAAQVDDAFDTWPDCQAALRAIDESAEAALGEQAADESKEDVMTDNETPVLAWHFVGDTLCESGLHASIRLIDALHHAPGATICRVEVAGEILYDYDKLVARKRRVLWRVDGELVLRAFARWCALQVAHLWDMPDVVRQYLETGGELLRDAARAAAWAAAWDAASSASRAAASAAAWAAAWDAASAAAEAAAWAAAWAAADATVWNAARDEQNEQLERMVEEARQGRIEWVWQDVLGEQAADSEEA